MKRLAVCAAIVSFGITLVQVGCSEADSPLSSPPTAPSNPFPENGATGVSTSLTLSWSCIVPDGSPLTFDVCIGTGSNPTTVIATGQTAMSIVQSGLANSMTYHWRVVAKDSKNATTRSSVWSFTTVPDVVVPGMVQVAAGTFTVGSTPVTISSFIIDKDEVTYELWTDVRNWGLTHGYDDLPAGKNGYNPVGSDNPVTSVSWFEAVKWCNARSEKDGLMPVYYIKGSHTAVYRSGIPDMTNDAVRWNANGYRLPTEAEWDFAARGGNYTRAFTYSGGNTVSDVAWYSGSSGFTTHPVGQKIANELGLCDMSGNVWEWCWDWYDSAYPSGSTTDPRGPSATQTLRSMRGGSFLADENYCRVTYRGSYRPDYGYFMIGFRCVRD